MVEPTVAVAVRGADEPAGLGVGYLRRLLGYANKVYALGAVLGRVRDGRPRPQIAMATVVRAVFACGLLRVRSFNALEPQLEEPELLAVLGLQPGPARRRLCSVDTLARALRRAQPASMQAMLAALIERAERNKVFRAGWIGALRYVALDGWEPIASRCRHCPQCLEREVQEGKQRVTEYYHRYVVALLLGPHEELVLGFEPIRNAWARRQAGERQVDGDEGEQTAAIRLLRWLRATYGRWLEVIVVDSLYPNGPFLTVLAELGFAGVVVAKKESDEPLRDALAIWGDRPGQVVIDTDARERLELWDCPDCQTLASYAGPIRVVRGVVDSLGRPAPRRHWCLLVVGKVTQRLSARQLLRVGRARWHIENTGFNQWTQHWRFEHVFTTDGTAIAALFALFFVAFNVLQLFVYRQLKSYGRLRGKDPTRTISRVVDVLLADLHRLTAPVPWDSS